jgi:membrane associated rhomboid family serine protease
LRDHGCDVPDKPCIATDTKCFKKDPGFDGPGEKSQFIIMYGYGFGSQDNKAVKALIIANVAVFLVINIFRQVPWFLYLGLVPSLVLTRFMFWQFVTYLFVHANLWHLVINMLMLWMFGQVIENTWGSKRFLFYYFFTGIGAGLCSVIFAFNASYPVVGASGAIFGLLAAFAVMFPESVILLFLIFPMKMKHAVLVLAGINLLGALSNPGGGIAYVAHLGGGIFGWLYLKNENIRFALAKFDFDKVRKNFKHKQQVKKQQQLKDIDRKVDEILDKISSQGMDSLTKQEKEILKQKSKL